MCYIQRENQEIISKLFNYLNNSKIKIDPGKKPIIHFKKSTAAQQSLSGSADATPKVATQPSDNGKRC